MGLWKDRSAAVIGPALDALPLGATEEECRKALREAYPFGPREHYPYKAWCRECRLALEKRFAGRAGAKAPPRPPRFVLSREHPRPCWLSVACGWCEGLPITTRGCIVCGALEARVGEVVADPQFRALADAARRGDGLARRVLADWLLDQGIDAEEA